MQIKKKNKPSLDLCRTNHTEPLITSLGRTQITQTSADTHRNPYSQQKVWKMISITRHMFDIHSQNVSSDSHVCPQRGCWLTESQAGSYSSLLVGKWHQYSAWHTNSQGEHQKEAWEKTVHNYCKVPCSDCRQTTGCALYPVCHLGPPLSLFPLNKV